VSVARIVAGEIVLKEIASSAEIVHHVVIAHSVHREIVRREIVHHVESVRQGVSVHHAHREIAHRETAHRGIVHHVENARQGVSVHHDHKEIVHKEIAHMEIVHKESVIHVMSRLLATRQRQQSLPHQLHHRQILVPLRANRGELSHVTGTITYKIPPTASRSYERSGSAR
jgi:hypothetical protein